MLYDRKINESKIYSFDDYKKTKESYSEHFKEEKILLYEKDYDCIAMDIEEEEVDKMDSKNTNDLLIKYIDNIDKKYNDYKQDMIESEKRIYQNIKDSEDRYEKRQSEFEQRLDKRFENIEKTFDKIERKFEILSSDINENNKYLKSLIITTIISVGAMAVSVIIGAVGIVTSLK